MHRSSIFCGFVVTMAAFGCTTTPGPSRSASLLQGTWVGDPNGGCVETLRFSADGSIHVRSRDEVLEGSYVIADAGAPDVLKVTRTIKHSNRQLDCSGEARTPTGMPQAAFAFFRGSSFMQMCIDREGTRCFGPFTKAQ